MDACRRVITLSTTYANERVQFGVPIAKFGAIKHKLADMAIRTFAIESATYRAGAEIEKNIGKLESGICKSVRPISGKTANCSRHKWNRADEIKLHLVRIR